MLGLTSRSNKFVKGGETFQGRCNIFDNQFFYFPLDLKKFRLRQQLLFVSFVSGSDMFLLSAELSLLSKP